MKWQQMTQRWVETATATEQKYNSAKYQQRHGFLLKLYVKLQVLKFSLGTYVTPLRGSHWSKMGHGK